jgi:hypothetical protein
MRQAWLLKNIFPLSQSLAHFSVFVNIFLIWLGSPFLVLSWRFGFGRFRLSAWALWLSIDRQMKVW